MGLFRLLTGKTPQEHEHKGDAYFQIEAWGQAKIEYDKALSKLVKKSPQNDDAKTQLKGKIRRTQEALANEHKQTAANLTAAGYVDDAQQYINLALELTEDPKQKNELEKQRENLAQHIARKLPKDLPDIESADEADEEDPETDFEEQGDDYFRALIGALPQDVQEAYLSYGDDFKAGYLALNQADFELAATHLEKSMEAHTAPDSMIPLELATVYLNLEKYKEACQLLDAFLLHHPDALPGYQLQCEIYWEMEAFDKAEKLLSACPQELTQSVAFYLLRGETLFRAGKYSEAKSLYLDFLNSYSWNEPIARSLAQTHEALREMANARNIYREIMKQCRSCHARIDPFVKQKYADLCFSSGIYTTEVLELYLSLAQKDRGKAADYYQKISQIYSAQGNEEQARRFNIIAEKMTSEG